MQEAIRSYTSGGGNIIVSGAYIGTDIWDQVYPVENDEDFRKSSIEFAQKVLGYRWQGNIASRNGTAIPYGEDFNKVGILETYNSQNAVSYCVEAPDGIAPASSDSRTVLRYSDTSVPAGIVYQGKGYKTVCLGFPIEILKDNDDIRSVIASSLSFLSE